MKQKDSLLAIIILLVLIALGVLYLAYQSTRVPLNLREKPVFCEATQAGCNY